MHDVMYCTSNTPTRFLAHRVTKRAMDICLTLPALVLLLPLFGVLALCIRWEDNGPVFYWQERVSRGGEVFKMCKFRTMHVASESESGPVWASKNDDRTTAVGRFLRRSSLDELPQLWNVLKGEMSLIGPRPERPFFVERFSREIPGYADRHRVKSGITGWAQVNGLRGNTCLRQRVEHDLHYIAHWSPALDGYILVLSVITVVRDYVQKQAY